MNSQRIDIRIPKTLLEEIEKYQKKNYIQNRTTALLELVRKGLENDVRNKG